MLFEFIHCSSGGLHQFTDLAEGERSIFKLIDFTPTPDNKWAWNKTQANYGGFYQLISSSWKCNKCPQRLSILGIIKSVALSIKGKWWSVITLVRYNTLHTLGHHHKEESRNCSLLERGFIDWCRNIDAFEPIYGFAVGSTWVSKHLIKTQIKRNFYDQWYFLS